MNDILQMMMLADSLDAAVLELDMWRKRAIAAEASLEYTDNWLQEERSKVSDLEHDFADIEDRLVLVTRERDEARGRKVPLRGPDWP